MHDFVVSGGYRRAVAVVASIYGDVSQAEDAVSEAMTRACEREAGGEVIRDWRAWVVKVALNDCASLSRRVRRSLGKRHLLAGPESHEADGLAEARDALDALRRLGKGQREALVLYYYADMPVAEVADVLGISVAAVKTALHKGRINLARLLEREASTP